MKRFLRENSLSICFGILFSPRWRDSQSPVGRTTTRNCWPTTNLSSPGGATSIRRTSVGRAGELAVGVPAVLHVYLATIWFLQKGSNESKKLDDVGFESDEQQRVGRFAGPNSPWLARTKGLAHHLYANSLLIVMGAIFIGSWFGSR